DGADHQARVDLVQTDWVEAELGGGTGQEVLQENVGLFGQTVKQGHALGGSQIEGNGALVAVAGEEVGAELLVAMERYPGRAPGAGLVAAAGALDLDNLGSEITQNLATQWPGQDARSVEDAQASQVGSRGSFHPVLLCIRGDRILPCAERREYGS